VFALLIFLLNCWFAAASSGDFKFVWRADGSPGTSVLDLSTRESVRISPKVRLEVLRFQRPLWATLMELQNQNGAVICDCGIFVQLVARLEAEENPSGVLIAPEGNPAQYIACACDRDLAYLRPSHVDTFLGLQKSSFAGKGYWLLPTKDGRYLSILGEDPVEGTAAEWQKWSREMLLTEYIERLSCSENLVRGTEAWVELKYVELQFRAGALDSWTITPIPQDLVPKGQRRAVRRIFTRVGK